MAKNNIIPIFIPFAGCTSQCSYCNQWKITGINRLGNSTEIRREIDTQLDYFSHSGPIQVAFYGGTFTMLPFSHQLAYFHIVEEYIQNGLIESIRISTRPDAIDNDELKILKSRGLKTVELGIQSIDEDVLTLTNRNVDRNRVTQSVQWIQELGLELGLQQMIGLPDDSLEKSVKTAEWMLEKHPSFVRIYPTLVIRGTELEKMYERGEYEPLSLQEAILWTASLLDLFEEEHIPVIRVGLPPMENSEDIVAGPYHPQFREFAESYRMVQRIESAVNVAGTEAIYIYGSKRNINRIAGPKGFGRRKLQDHLGAKVYFKTIPEEESIQILASPYEMSRTIQLNR